MSSGIDYFKRERFREAVEYFTEVVRLVCQFRFVAEAYLYEAKCRLQLVSQFVCYILSGSASYGYLRPVRALPFGKYALCFPIMRTNKQKVPTWSCKFRFGRKKTVMFARLFK